MFGGHSDSQGASPMATKVLAKLLYMGRHLEVEYHSKCPVQLADIAVS
jgi:hypothetical protein